MKFKVKYALPSGKILWWTEPNAETSSLYENAHIYDDKHDFSASDLLLFINKRVVLVVQH